MAKTTFLTLGVVAVLVISFSKLSSVLAELSDVGNDRVTLRTVDAGTFIGQRIGDSQSGNEDDSNELPRYYFAFRGIPYATAKRLEGPEPPEVRKQPRVTTHFKPSCPQWNFGKQVVGNQECLSLNVFTVYVPNSIKRPVVPVDGQNLTSWSVVENRNLLPVLFYVHGGEWIAGSSDNYGPQKLMQEDIVLVTFNYRIGLLGFLSNGEESLPGNLGILDQIEALRWVQQNIYRFGGNPSRVCIFGNVEHLLVTPGAKGLFHAAIVSPVSTSSIYSPLLRQGEAHNPKKLFDLVASEAGCTFTDSQETLDCLRQLQPESFARIQHQLLKFFSYSEFDGVRIGPVADTWQKFPTLPSSLEDLMEEGKLPSVPIMIGLSAFEGFNPFLEFYLKLGTNRKELLKDKQFIMDKLEGTLRTILQYPSTSDFQPVLQSIWDFYFPNTSKWNDTTKITWKLFRLFGDLTFNAGHSKLAHVLSEKSKAPVYSYIFNASLAEFMGYLDHQVKEFEDNNPRNSSLKWSLHSTRIPPWKELAYIFSPLDNPPTLTLNDTVNSLQNVQLVPEEQNGSDALKEKLSKMLIKLWVSFAKYGSPKHSLPNAEGRWTRANGDNLNHFVIGEGSSYPLKGEFRKAESNFWLKTLPQIQAFSQQIQDLEPFPILFWIFVGLTALFLFISLVLCLCICCRSRNDRGKIYYS